MELKDIIYRIHRKSSNIVWSADLTKSNSILDLLDKIGLFIIGIKIHSDIIEDFDMDFIKKLKILVNKYDLFIIEDRKFSDIGSTVEKQLNGGHKIGEWADLITVHSIMGEGVIQGLKGPKILLIAQASSEGNLIDKKYTKHTINMAKKYKDRVIGFISQDRLYPGFIHMTPGVNLTRSSDDKGQNYRSPRYLIGENLTDILIVGRGIHCAKDPIAEVKKYQNEGYQAYYMNDLRRGEFAKDKSDEDLLEKH